MVDAVQSVLRQTYRNFELIVLDDGSTDSTGELCQTLAKKDSRIRYLRTRNQGVSAARNHAIRRARYDWLAFNDSDDLWEKTKLEEQVSAMLREDVDVVFVSGHFFWDSNRKVKFPFGHIHGRLSGTEMLAVMIDQMQISPPMVLARKQAMVRAGLFPTRGLQARYCDDWPLFLKMADQGCEFYGIDKPLHWYRLHSKSNCSNGSLVYTSALQTLEKYRGHPRIPKQVIDSAFFRMSRQLLACLFAERKFHRFGEVIARARKISLRRARELEQFLAQLT